MGQGIALCSAEEMRVRLEADTDQLKISREDKLGFYPKLTLYAGQVITKSERHPAVVYVIQLVREIYDDDSEGERVIKFLIGVIVRDIQAAAAIQDFLDASADVAMME
ncbi:MAG: hypothetical protein QG568_713 [Patescibacteria group bacterium]|nr:hypothetical protein [Patescibacteria group bacterium]